MLPVALRMASASSSSSFLVLAPQETKFGSRSLGKLSLQQRSCRVLAASETEDQVKAAEQRSREPGELCEESEGSALGERARGA